jgi:hypothetical protein
VEGRDGDDPPVTSFEFQVSSFQGRGLPIVSQEITQSQSPHSPTAGQAREHDAIYQNDHLRARVLDPEVDVDGKVIRFGEVYNSDELLLPEECEFQKYRILIQRIAYASKVNKDEPHKGRILRGVTAEILGYREQ